MVYFTSHGYGKRTKTVDVMNNHTKQSNKNAFTLVELLVVIAIIALLVSMLMPALSKAKASAQKVVCASNIKDIGIAWQLYGEDFNGYLYKNCNVNMPAISVKQARFNYGGRESTLTGLNKPILCDRPLNEYMGYDVRVSSSEAIDVFKCPSDRGKIMITFGSGEIQLPLTQGGSCYDSYGNSYFGNIFMFDIAVPPSLNPASYKTWLAKKMNKHLKVDTLHGPSEVLFLGDAPWAWQWDPKMPEEPSWHQMEGFQNMLYLDGHVAFVKINKFDLPTLTEKPDPSRRIIPYRK